MYHLYENVQRGCDVISPGTQKNPLMGVCYLPFLAVTCLSQAFAHLYHFFSLLFTRSAIAETTNIYLETYLQR